MQLLLTDLLTTAVKDVKVSAVMKSTDSNRRIKGKNNLTIVATKEDEELIDLFFTL